MFADYYPQLHLSYSSLGKDCKTIFEDLFRQINAQKKESDRLRHQLECAGDAIVQSNESVSNRIQDVLNQERVQAAEERQQLLAQISTLINSQAELQESRLAGKAALLQKTVSESNQTFQGSVSQYSEGMDAWNSEGSQILDSISKSKAALKKKLKDDWSVCAPIFDSLRILLTTTPQTANEHSTSIQGTAKSVHTETIRVVDQQKNDLDVQMKDLDDFVTRARSENSEHHKQHAESMQSLSETIEKSFSNISTHFTNTFDRVRDLGDEMETDSRKLTGALAPLEENICRPLSNLRDDINSTVLREYEPTGDTPEKKVYHYPTELPRTETPGILVAGLGDTPSPSKGTPAVFNDLDLLAPPTTASSHLSPPMAPPQPRNPLSMSLREVNPNLTTGAIMFDPSASTMSLPAIKENATLPIFSKRSTSSSLKPPSTRYAKKQTAAIMSAIAYEGSENVPPGGAFSQSTNTRRKSPRLN